MKIQKLLIFGLIFQLVLGTLTCKKENSIQPEELEKQIVTTIEIFKGNNQEGEFDKTLLIPIEVIVKDQNDSIVRGAKIYFSVNEGKTSSETVQSNSDGIAQIYWTLGATVGKQALTINYIDEDEKKSLSNLSLYAYATATASNYQTTFERIRIDNSTNSPQAAYASDFDNDNDLDIIVAYRYGGISWFKNIDGFGDFSDEIVITNEVDFPFLVLSPDLNNDGNPDILTESYRDHKVVWFRNLGYGSFFNQKIITDSSFNISAVFSSDIDSDGDKDVMLAMGGDTIELYNNVGGIFSRQQVITNSAWGSSTIFSCDLDSDNDFDILSSSHGSDKLFWYENLDGAGSFGSERIIDINSDGIKSVYSCDIDGDGDNDIISASEIANTIQWYENIDGNGNFSEKKIIQENYGNPWHIYACDIDRDGDNDVIAVSFLYDNTISWYENIDGNGNFSEQKIISNSDYGPIHIYACDIDNDEDNDIIVCSQNYVTLYKNHTPIYKE